MLTRRALAVALVSSAAALTALPAAPAVASSDAQMCRIVIDPYQQWTPLGYVQVPRVYCVSP